MEGGWPGIETGETLGCGEGRGKGTLAGGGAPGLPAACGGTEETTGLTSGKGFPFCFSDKSLRASLSLNRATRTG